MSVQNFIHPKLSVGIIGAGPAGAMAAYLLSQQGHKVHILEKKKEIGRKICGEYLCPKGVELLEELNLYSELCTGFETLNGMVLVSPQNDVIRTYFPKTSKLETGVSLNRKIFDQRLLDLALKQNATLSNNQTVLQVKELPTKQWSVTTATDHYVYDFLIVADGRQSKIGRQLGHIKELNTKRAALHCYLPRKTNRGQRLGEMHILPKGNYCGLDPISDDEVNFSIVCDSSRMKKESAKEIINSSIKNSKYLFDMFDLVNDQTDIKTVSSLKNHNNFIAGNNLAYVGDAAGFIDPLTGEGIYNALLSSKILSTSILQSESIEVALKRYKDEKKKIMFQKNLLNNFFQIVIRTPLLITILVLFLKRSQKRADHFIGIVGNIHNPLTGFIKMLKA